MKQKTELAGLFVRIRKEAGGLTQEQFAGSIGISPGMVAQVETGRKVIGIPTAEAIAKRYGFGDKGQSLLNELKKAILQSKDPEAHRFLAQEGEPPDIRFVEQLRQDMEQSDLTVEEVVSGLSLTAEGLREILSGKGRISRRQVVALAKKLGKKPADYLFSDGYLPEEMIKNLERHPTLAVALRSAGGLSDEQALLVTKVIETIVRENGGGGT